MITNNNIFNNTSDNLGEIPRAKVRLLVGLVVFFAVIGLQLLINPFLYSRNYIYTVVEIIILAFGASIAFILSLYLTERLIIKNKLKVWKIAVISLISSLLFGFLYLISFYFYLQTIGPSEGLEFIVGIMMGVVFTLFSIFLFFITNLIFYKKYNHETNNKIYILLLALPIVFSLITIGLKVNDYYDCNFSKDENCFTEKASLGNDVSFCEKNKYANPHDRNECRIAVSKNSNDPSICREIEDGAGRNPEDFKYQCFANIALNTKNYSLCEELKERSYRNECYASIGNKTSDVSICNKVINDPDQFSDCIENIAINTDNRSLCDKVDSENKRGCYLGFDLNLSKTSGDTAICDKIKNEGWGSSQIGSCFSYVAAYTDNYSLCEKVSDYSNSRDVCYLGVSRKSTNIGICDKIRWQYNGYQCIVNIAINTSNRNLCEKAYSDYKDNCYSDFDKKEKQ